MNKPDFDDAWYPDEQIAQLRACANSTVHLTGSVVEVGSWKGKSTIALAQVFDPDIVCAVDTWRGSIDESPDHETVRIIAQQNIREVFQSNVRIYGLPNIQMYVMDWREFFTNYRTRTFRDGIRFLHLDGSHDYHSVFDNIQAALPHIVPGGMICGDDILTAHAGRTDLYGGVEKAVRDALPGYGQNGNFWWWRKQ